jgi:FkbM family methyltransferase
LETPYLLSGCFLNKHKMTPLRRLIKNALIKMTGNRFAQDMLEEIVQISHILQGVGTGSSGSCEVRTSGEKAIFDALKQKHRAPYCIFDVGSNKGQFLQLALENIATDNYSIHCFEPGRETFRFLDESFRKDTRIKLNNVGIGKEKGEALLYYDAAGSGCASLTKRKLDHLGINFDKSETVHITTIDDYCSENGISHIHLLKMDIEGHELDALVGAERMFERKSIDIVTFEFGGCNVDTKTFFQDFWYFFSDADMKLFRITPTGYLYPIESYSEIHEKILVSNFMAVLNG